MTYDPTRAGLAEATRAWIVAIIQANLDSLNTALQRDGLLTVDITSAMVMRGDPKTLPSQTEAPLMICVSGGGQFGADMAIAQKYVPLSYHHDIHSAISVYIHPQALPVPTGNDYESGREMLLDRVCDWLRAGIFNTVAHVSPVLQSREFDASGDKLGQSHISDIEQGQAQKGFAGSQIVSYARMVHSAWIEGSV